MGKMQLDCVVFRGKGGFLAALLCISFLIFISVSDGYTEQTGREKADALMKASDGFRDDGNIDKALEAAKEAIKADPAYPEAQEQLGEVLLKKGLADEALNAFNTALKINPRLRSAKTGIGLALLKKGDLKGAEEKLREALMLNPYPSMAHYALGLVYEKQNNYEKAVEEFKEGIKKYKSGKK